MEIALHKVKKITRSVVGGGNTRWREITIFTENGDKLEITCFADSFDKLLIKENNQ